MGAIGTIVTRAGAVAAAVTTAAAIAYALGTATWRPLDITEGELLFLASRIRSGLPLFVDPHAGAWDYGPVPARYYVLYTPLWAWFMAALPAAGARAMARLVATAAWFGAVAAVASVAPRGRRLACWTFAGFAASSFLLLRSAVVAAPDTAAVAIATWALMRTVRRERLDGVAASLFAVAALVKPNVLGLGAGVLVEHVLSERGLMRRLLVPLVWGGAVLALAVTGFQLASGGTWWANLLAGSGQELTLARGVEQVGSRLPYFGVPQALGFFGARRLARPSRFALAALAASTAWTVFSMAKSGSTTNYWLEPTIALLVVLATSGSRDAPSVASGATDPAGTPASDPFAPFAGVLAGVLAIASAAGTLPALADMRAGAKQKVDAIAQARARCTLAPGEALVASDPALEFELMGRIVTTPFEMTNLTRHGRFPLSIWSADLARPEVRWLVLDGDALEKAPPVGAEARKETSALAIELRSQVLRDFSLDSRAGSFRIYRRNAP